MIENGMIEFGSDDWMSLLGEIAANYGDGKIIKHEWLKARCGIKTPSLKDYETVNDFLKSIESQRLDYVNVINRLRWDLVKEYKMYIKSQVGEGYMVIRPEDQTQFGYDSFVNDIKKAIREANLIMNNVLQVDKTQQAKDNDLRAKFGVMRQMLASVKTKM